MKLPEKIWITEEIAEYGGETEPYLSINDPADLSPGAVPYVPASEAEALRERVKELEVRELQLHGLLGEAAGYIKGQTEGHFHAMGKAYLAKEHLENNGLLKRISEALGGGEKK